MIRKTLTGIVLGLTSILPTAKATVYDAIPEPQTLTLLTLGLGGLISKRRK